MLAGGFMSQAAQEAAALRGSSGSPILRSYDALDPADAEVLWQLSVSSSGTRVQGDIQSSGHDVGAGAIWTSDNALTDWVNIKDYLDLYWARATLNAGDAPTLGSGLGTWLSLVKGGSQRFWGWRHTSIPGSTDGSIKLEISTDSSGTVIVATGYYRALCTVSA